MFHVETLQKKEDEEAAKKVIATVLHDEYGIEVNPALDLDLSNLANYYRQAKHLCLIAKDDTEVIGTAALRPLSTQDAEIKRMFILAPYRGQGLGTLFMSSLLEAAKQFQFKRLLLDTRQEMTVAIKLYQRFGFQPIESYNQNHRADLFMERLL